MLICPEIVSFWFNLDWPPLSRGQGGSVASRVRLSSHKGIRDRPGTFGRDSPQRALGWPRTQEAKITVAAFLPQRRLRAVAPRQIPQRHRWPRCAPARHWRRPLRFKPECVRPEHYFRSAAIWLTAALQSSLTLARAFLMQATLATRLRASAHCCFRSAAHAFAAVAACATKF